MLNSQAEIKLAAQAAGSGGSGAGGLHKSPLSPGPTWQGGGESWSSCLHHQKLLLSQSSAHFLGLPGGQLNMIISRAAPAARLARGWGRGGQAQPGALCIPPGHGGSLPQSPGDAALPFVKPKPRGSAGTVLPGRWPHSREMWILVCSSRYGILFTWAAAGDGDPPSAGVSPRHWQSQRPGGPRVEQDPEPSAPRVAASPGHGGRSSSCSPCAGRPGRARGCVGTGGTNAIPTTQRR